MLLGLISDWLRDPNLFEASHAGAMLDALFRGLIQNWELDILRNKALCNRS